MDITKRALTFFTFFICCGCLAFLTASLATPEWIIAKPERIGVSTSLTNSSNDSSKFKGYVNLGLFEGDKLLNHGFGTRKTHIYIRQEMGKNPEMISFGLWLVTVLSIALAMVLGLVSAVFAVINTVLTPVEMITGLSGLYIWNSLGALLSLAAAGSWLAQFFLRLRHNVMSTEELEQHWSSTGRAQLGYSFWFTVVAGWLFGLNVLIVKLVVRGPPRAPKPRLAHLGKHPEGAIMLY